MKSLASRPQVLENWPVLGSRTALFFELLKFCGALEKFLRRPFFFFFWRALGLVSLALASNIPILGLESVCPRKGCPWPRIFFVSLASSLVSSTVADLGGGCIPSHQPKSNDFGRKISLNFEKLGSISGRISPPTSLNLTILGEKSLSISVKTFFFFLFWRPPDFGQKKRLNFRFRAKNHSQFRCRPFFFFFLETT